MRESAPLEWSNKPSDDTNMSRLSQIHNDYLDPEKQGFAPSCDPDAAPVKMIIYEGSTAIPVKKGRKHFYKDAPRKLYWDIFQDDPSDPHGGGPIIATFHRSKDDAIAFCDLMGWQFECA